MKDSAAIETLPLGTYWPVFIKKTFQFNEGREKAQNLSHSSSEATGKTSTYRTPKKHNLSEALIEMVIGWAREEYNQSRGNAEYLEKIKVKNKRTELF